MEFDFRLRVRDYLALLIIKLPVDNWTEETVTNVKSRFSKLLKVQSYTDITLLNNDCFDIKILKIIDLSQFGDVPIPYLTTHC